MRVVVSALAICAISFIVGIAGDLSSASTPAPARPAIVELPPMDLPPVDLENAVRARPLTPASSSAAAAERAAPVEAAAPAESAAPRRATPVVEASETKSPTKSELLRAAKPGLGKRDKA